MFDNVPPNLPVEPASQTPPPPPPTPSGVQPKPIVMSQTKKEPEDIFADVNVGADDVQTMPNAQDIYGTPKKSQLPMIAVIVVGIVVLGGVAFAAWYFLIRQETVPVTDTAAVQQTTPAATQQQPEIIEQPPVTANEVTTLPPAGSNIPLPEPATEVTATETSPEAALEPTPEVPPVVTVVPTEGLDADSDGLTDVEEVLLGTNPQIVDTDGDGFNDGSETVNLYSPVAASQPLNADTHFSAAVWEAKTPLNSYTWTFLRPQVWLLNGESVMQAILSTDTPARFVFSLATTADIPPNAPFKTRSGLDAVRSSDGLTTYVYSGDGVIAVTYDLNGAATYDYRTLYDAIINSLKMM